VAALADAVIARAMAETQPGAAIAPIVQRHAGTVPPAQIAALTELVQEAPASRTTRMNS
jgi:hypothetical protein